MLANSTKRTRLSIICTLAIGLLCHSQAQTFLTNGLVAYYPFNSDANDATGNGNNGQVNSALLVPDRFGHPKSAYLFNGSDSFIILTNSFSLPGDWTVSAWASTTTTNQQGYILHIGTDETAALFSDWGNTNQNGFGMYCTNNGWIYFVVNQRFSWGGAPLETNTWFQVIMRQASGFTEFFLNGVFYNGFGYSFVTNAPQISPVQGFIGAGSTKTSFFNGAIDDVRVYNRALTDFEIQQLYANEAGVVITLQKALRPSFSNLLVGTNYQLQASTDLNNWTNQGASFTATNTAMPSAQYFDADTFNQLFFRLQVTP
jgi:Concanavalin A-like lectin/glucanases superfamily